MTHRIGLLRANSYAVNMSIVCLSLAACLATGQAAELSGTGPGGAPHTVQFDNLVIFGDSLSDVGNLYKFLPYWNGRFSNGPVWIEQLAADLGMLAPTPSSLGGNNFAWGGAQTGTGSSPAPVVPNVREQVGLYLATEVVSPTALYVLWAGANDFFNGETDPSIPAGNMAAAVNTLEVAGACNFLVLNLPPLGRTPMYLNNDAAAAGITALAEGFNTDLAAGLASLDGIGKTILLHDAYSDFTRILATPSQFGLQNTTGQVMDTGLDQNVFLFWDDVHPTTVGHGLVTASVLVPEPGTAALLALGCLAVVTIRLKKKLA